MAITITFNSFLTALRWKLHSEMNIEVVEGNCEKLRVNLTKMQMLQGWYQNPFFFVFKKGIIHDSRVNPICHFSIP